MAGRRDHNIIFASGMVLKSPTALSYGPERFIVPTAAMPPQGKKAFFWAVNKHPRPRLPSEKYIALAIVQDHRRGTHIVSSPDGIHWACSPSPFWQTPHDVSSKGDDCLMHVFFDDAKQKWALYRRIVPEFSERMIANDSDRERPPVDRYNRSYAYAESENLKEWKNHQFILAMDADDPADTDQADHAGHAIDALQRQRVEKDLRVSACTHDDEVLHHALPSPRQGAAVCPSARQLLRYRSRSVLPPGTRQPDLPGPSTY